MSKNNQSKMDWRCDSSGRAPALQVQSPEFKAQSHLKTKQNKNLGCVLCHKGDPQCHTLRCLEDMPGPRSAWGLLPPLCGAE
jgi:hypothetical protein